MALRSMLVSGLLLLAAGVLAAQAQGPTFRSGVDLVRITGMLFIEPGDPLEAVGIGHQFGATYYAYVGPASMAVASPDAMEVPRDRWFCMQYHAVIGVMGSVEVLAEGETVVSATGIDTLPMGGIQNVEVGLEYTVMSQKPLAIYVDDRIKDYCVRIVHATRRPKEFGLDAEGLLQYGASPRATMALVIAARAHAFLRGRGFVTPEDVKAIGADVLRHRLILSFEAEAENVDADDVVRRVFDAVEVP